MNGVSLVSDGSVRPVPALSIVASMYCSAPYLHDFHARASRQAQRFAGDDYEIILVNDGSPDDSLALALGIQAHDRHLRVVDLSRNFGHHPAMWTGLQQARGAWVYLIDCDLEERPEWLETLEAVQRDTAADVVYGVQATRQGSLVTRLAGSAFYKLFNGLSTVPIPENVMTVRLMSRRYVDALLRHTEVTFVISGLWARTGFQQVAVPFTKGRKGASHYTLYRQLRLLINSITAFSSIPLFGIFYLGLVLLLTSIAAAALVVVRSLFFGKVLDGWPSLMLATCFFGGLAIFCQGVVGIYVARIFEEAKRRPLTIVRRIHEAQGVADVPALHP